MSSSIGAWLQAARPLAQANIAIPLLLGESLAFHVTGEFDGVMLIAAHAFGIGVHGFVVFTNDVADEAADRLNTTFNAFSGGSRVLPEGKLSRRALAIAAGVCGLASLLLCVGLAWAGDRPAMLGAWVLAIALCWAYSFAPLRLSYRGLGEVTQGLGVGVVLPAVGWYLQIGDVQTLPWAALAPAFALAFASNISTALPDHGADTAASKWTWPVRMGQARARKHSLQIIAVAALLTPLVLPHATHAELLAAEVGPVLALLWNLRLRAHADAERRPQCARFVFFNLLAINLALLGWSALLVMSAPGSGGA